MLDLLIGKQNDCIPEGNQPAIQAKSPFDSVLSDVWGPRRETVKATTAEQLLGSAEQAISSFVGDRTAFGTSELAMRRVATAMETVAESPKDKAVEALPKATVSPDAIEFAPVALDKYTQLQRRPVAA